MKPTLTTSVLDKYGCRIIWGFLLENTLFTAFEEHNHAIIEKAYRQRKKKQASHYIVIVDANLPKPCKAKVYFGVVQNHLRMPGTRYYVTRHVVQSNTVSTPNITSTKSSSLAPPPPALMPSPMSTTSSSTLSSDIAYPSLDRSIAALFSDGISLSPSTSSSTSNDSVNTFNCNNTDRYLPNRDYFNSFLLGEDSGERVPHSFNDNYNSFLSADYGTTAIYNDQNNIFHFVNNSNTKIDNPTGNVYIASNDGINYFDQLACNNKYDEKANGHFALRNCQNSNYHPQQDAANNHVYKYNMHDNAINIDNLGSSTVKRTEAISDVNNLLVEDMGFLSFWDFSKIDNSSFQELVSWPVFDVPKQSYGQEQDISLANYLPF